MNASNDKSVTADSVGEFLRRERERRHIGLDAVAERTKISRRYLEAIEDGQYDRLPGKAFVRGFIRSYAQTLGLDPEDALLLYDQARVVQEIPPLRAARPSPVRPSRNERSLQWLLVTAVVVVGGVLLGIIGIYEGPALLGFNSTPRVDVAKAPTPPTPLILTATVDSDSWIRVTIDDQDVQDTLLRAGQSAKWMGQERFVLSVGNVHATHLLLNGRPLAIPQTAESLLRHYTISRAMLP